jgi:hemoglobin
MRIHEAGDIGDDVLLLGSSNKRGVSVSRPSIFEVAGGAPVFEPLTSRFYEKVKADPLLASVFASFSAEHAKNVAIWLGEVFGGPPRYSEDHGGHRTVLERHRNLALTRDQKERWVELMLETARDVLPNDNDLQTRFADYIRWGAQIALKASQAGFEIKLVGPVPKWGWTKETDA